MPARRAKPVKAVDRVKLPDVKDVETSRALQELDAAIQGLQGRHSYDVVEGVDLAIGRNAVPHKLGRAPKIVTFAPTVADATFAWSLEAGNQPDRQVFINVIGAAQPRVSLLLM